MDCTISEEEEENTVGPFDFSLLLRFITIGYFPPISVTLYTVVAQLVNQEVVTNFIKRLREVHYDYILLMASVHCIDYVIYEAY